MAMAISLVASTHGLALMLAYARNLLPRSVVSQPLEGEAPTIDVAVAYSKSNGETMTLSTSATSPTSEAGSRPGVTGHGQIRGRAVRP